MNDCSGTRPPAHPSAACLGVFWFRSFPTVSCIALSLTASTSWQSCIFTVGQVTGVHDSETVLPNNRLERSGSKPERSALWKEADVEPIHARVLRAMR